MVGNVGQASVLHIGQDESHVEQHRCEQVIWTRYMSCILDTVEW